MHRLAEIEKKLDNPTTENHASNKELKELLCGLKDIRHYFRSSGDVVVASWLLRKIVSIESVMSARGMK